MAVKFISTIKENGIGGWCIELIDTLSDERVICYNLNEYEENIERMGAEHGGDIEVKWKKDKNVTAAHMEEVRIEISKYQKVYNEEVIS